MRTGSAAEPQVPREVVWALAGLGVLNLALGARLALAQTNRANDLFTMYAWCRDWLFDGTNLYQIADASTDYPPNAIVALAPLALVSSRWIVRLWIVISLCLAPVLPYVVARGVSLSPRRIVWLSVAAFLCWSSARQLLQFSLLSMTLAFTAVWLADSRRMASGICLGLALAKPQIAAPVTLWLLLTGRARIAAVAVGVVAIEFALYCVRAQVGPGATLLAWWGILADTYAGARGLIGLTTIRAWVHTGAAGSSWRDVVWLGTAAALLAVPVRMAIASRRTADRDRALVLGSFCLWSLLACYHNGHDLILMLPAFVACWVAEPATTWERPLVLGLLQAAMMADVPDRLASVAPASGFFRMLIVDFDRYVVLLTFAYLTLLWRRGGFDYNTQTGRV